MPELLELKTINDNLNHLKSFVYDLEICISNVDQIISAQNAGLFLKPTEGFVGHYVFLAYSICAINCYKIFNKKEKRGFLKLFNKIENYTYDDEIISLFSDNQNKENGNELIKSKEELIGLCNDLRDKIETKSTLIEKISNRRSKFYAHSDPDAINYEKEKLSDIKELKDLAKLVYRQFYGSLYGVHFMFEVNIASIKPVLDDRKFVDDYYKGLEDELEKD